MSRKLRINKIAQERLKALKLALADTGNDPDRFKSVWHTFKAYAAEVDGFIVPTHMKPYVDKIVEGLKKEVRVVFHTPAQHTKTTTTNLTLAYVCATNPGKRHIYITYNYERSIEVAKDFAAMCRRLGMKVSRAGGLVEINGGRGNASGSTIDFTSVNGSITGKDVTGIAIIDDPIKSAEEARSKKVRDGIWDFFVQELSTRKSRGILSIVVMMTRWSASDLSGKLIDEHGWEYIRLPAICDDETTDPLRRKLGEPLFPQLHTKEDLEKQRALVGNKVWKSMYQGLPVAEGERPFDMPTTYDIEMRPRDGFVVSYGLDCAYAGNSSSDWSVCVRLLHHKASGITYVDDVIRNQCNIHDFLPRLEAFVKLRPGEVTWFVGGQEKVLAENLNKQSKTMVIKPVPATKSKYTRAQPCFVPWSEGKLLVPSRQSYEMQQFIATVTSFTGDNDEHDDDVDALAGAWDGLHNAPVVAIYHKMPPRASEMQRRNAQRRAQL